MNSLITFLNTTGKTFVDFSIPMLIQSSVLIIVLLGLDLLLRKKVRAVFRYCIWMLVLVKLVLPTTLSSPTGLGYWFGDKIFGIVSEKPLVTEQTAPMLPSIEPVSETVPSETVITVLPSANTAHAPIANIPAESAIAASPTVSLSWHGFAFLGWLAAVTAMALLLVQRMFFVRGLLAQSKNPNDSMIDIFEQCRKQMRVRKPIFLKLSLVTASPSVCGLFRPTILIPQNLPDKLKNEDLRSILLHELAHIKRGDLWVSLIQTILQIAYFYNPLLWAANAIIRKVREQAVDEKVLVAMGEQAEDYPETLLNISRLTFSRPALSLRLIGVIESKKALSGRIKHILSRPFPKTARLGLVGLLGIIIVAAILLPMANAQTEKDSAGLESGEEAQVGEAEQSNNKKIPNTVSGIVTDEAGRSRSYVRISPSGNNPWGKIRTDAEGRFTIENIEPEQKVWLAYSQHSKAMGVFAIPEKYEGQALGVVLNYQEADISGRVVDGNGVGLVNRKVELVFKTKEGLTFTIPVYGETDQYGVYDSSRGPCGYDLRVQAKVVNADENEKEHVTEPVALVDNQLNVEMPLLIIGQGQYKDSDDGRVLYSGRILNEQSEPVSGAEVALSYRWRNSMGVWGKETMTDTQGRWNIRLPVDHSNLSVRLLHPDYISFHYDQSSRQLPKAELLDGSNVMVMKKGLRIKGIVRTPEGKPVENSLVAAGRLYSSSDGMILEDCTTDRTRSDGSFSIGGLPQQQVDLDVSAPGYAPVIASVEVSKDVELVEVSLKKGRTYRGQIVDKDGNPLEEIKVSCREWNVTGDRRRYSASTKTDSQGLFSVPDLPDIGTLTFGFGRSRTPLQGFSKQMPEDISTIDRVTMYPVPVIAAKVIDAETKEPITNFTITQGCKWKSADEEPFWSRHRKNQISSEDGSFEKKWAGFGISYPFDGAAFIKIEAQGYYSKSTPPVELGKEYEPFVIELTRSEQLTGAIVDSAGNPAGGAEVGWVGVGRKAFIKDGKFDRGGFTYQAERIITADQQGYFSMNPERGAGLIVVMHEQGYAQTSSTDFQGRSEIKLIPWAKIEVTFDQLESEKNSEIGITTLTQRDNTDMTPHIYWMFDRFTTTKDSLTLEHIPAEPLHIAKTLRFEQHNATFLEPQPGKTHKIHLGQKGNTVKGKIKLTDSASHDYANPRQSHVAAFKVNGESRLPEKFKNLHRSSFNWLFQDQANVYPASRTYQNRFIPTIDLQGNFTLDNIPAGEYELVINLHDQLGKNVSCGRGVLKSASVVPFTVEKQRTITQLARIDLKRLIYPSSGQKAPLFEAKTFDGKTINLKDYRDKIVLLEFWATWCGPCIQQMPKIKKVYETFEGNKNFVMLGMNLDWDIKKAEKYVAVKKLNWPQLSLGNMAESDIVSKYGIGGVPTSILICPDGKIIAKNLHSEQIQAAIAGAISSNKDF
ncbi:MAG: M56 family metallopeptidase [Planctomycetota bacterium]